MAATCSSCGAPVFWVKTPKGKWMICDEGLLPYKADPEGKDFVVNDKGEMIRCNLLPNDGGATGMARRPHWATCPNLRQHKK